jgi:uncharacterized protein YuzE
LEDGTVSKPTFRVETSVDDATGAPGAVYLRVRDGKVAETKEVEGGVVYADYDAPGSLLGIELLGSCDMTVLEGVISNEPEPVKRFLRGGVPRGLVPAQSENANGHNAGRKVCG